MRPVQVEFILTNGRRELRAFRFVVELSVALRAPDVVGAWWWIAGRPSFLRGGAYGV